MSEYDIKFTGRFYDISSGRFKDVLNSVIRIGSLKECHLYLKNLMNEFSDKLIFNNDFKEPEYYIALQLLGNGSVHFGICNGRCSYYAHYNAVERPAQNTPERL